MTRTNLDGDDIDTECDFLKAYLEIQISEIRDKCDVNFQLLKDRIENLESELFNKDREISNLQDDIRDLRYKTESGDFYG